MARRRTEIMAFTGTSAGLGIAAATLIATVGKQPLSNPWFILFTVAAAAAGLVFVAAGLAPLVGWVRRVLKARRKPKPLILDRWQYTKDGSKAPALTAAMDVDVPGTTGTKPKKDDPPPWVRFAVSMACSEIDHHDDPDSQYGRFESFLLKDDLVKTMIRSLTGQDKATYSRQPASSPGIHDAVFGLGNKPSIVTARLDLPGKVQRNGSDSRSATMILHIQRSSPLVGLSARQQPDYWELQIRRALELPIPVARLLADLGFQTSGDPPAQVGVRLHAPNDLTEMVDTTGRSELPGETRDREATGYFVAGRDGKSAEDAAGTMVGDMLVYALKTAEM